MASNRARITLSAVCLSLATTLVGCSMGDSENPQIPPDIRASVVALTQTPPELTQAAFLAARSCLQKSGYAVPYSSTIDVSGMSSLVGLSGLFTSMEAARTYGYPSTLVPSAGPIDSFAESLPEPDRAAFETAYSGPKDAEQIGITLSSGAQVSQAATGCLAEANTAVYGSVEDSLLLSNFVNEVYAQLDVSDILAAVMADMPEYEACMSNAGYHVSKLDAGDLAEVTFGRYRAMGTPPSAAEADMAATDAGCQVEAGLIDDANEVFFTTARDWILANQGQIVARQESLTAALARAQSIIDNG